MSDAVFDATIIGKSNEGLLDPARTGAAMSGINLLSDFCASERKLFYNNTLEREYRDHTQHATDLINIFYTILASARAVKVKRNQLDHANNAKAHECNWPTHDRHLLAAALASADVTIYVTEDRLAGCAAAIRRRFKFTVRQINMP